MLEKQLRIRKLVLERLISDIKGFILKCPPGSLRIRSSRGYPVYLQHTDSGYVRLDPVADSETIRNLAKKDYYMKVVDVTRRELEAIYTLLSIKEAQELSMVYENLNPKRRPFVHQVEETHKEKVSLWLEQKAKPDELRTGNYYIPTANGEMVKSMNECIIANTLKRFNVPYKYEYPFICKTDGTKFHPDFQIMNRSTNQIFYWEHFGMMDDLSYVHNSMMDKIKKYAENGIILGRDLIATFSDKFHKLTVKEVEDIIRSFLL